MFSPSQRRDSHYSCTCLQCVADAETLEYSQKFLAKIKEEILAKEGVSNLRPAE